MIIGFLGKGGSGKSTLSTAFTKYLKNKDYNVLAIDADHNMDLSFNLGAPNEMEYIGTEGLSGILNHLNIEKKDISNFLQNSGQHMFNIQSPDQYTKKYTSLSSSGIKIMSAGPQSDKVIDGHSCSHSLASALKIYLPLLELQEDDFVVVDEKASVDAVTTGIPLGFHLVTIVVENTLHSIKAGKQIAETLKIFDVPYVFIANKIRCEEDLESIQKEVQILGHFSTEISESEKNVFDNLVNYTREIINKHGDRRKERMIRRYKH